MRTCLLLITLCLTGCLPSAERIQQMQAEAQAKAKSSGPRIWTDIDFQYYGKKDAQNTIKDVLKAPTTAKFSDFTVKHIDRKVVTVTGKVTSQNSFGAMLTEPFECIFWFDGTSLKLASSTLAGKKTHEGKEEQQLIMDYLSSRKAE
jgi:hypothetical protein